jgi:hypothetical protein
MSHSGNLIKCRKSQQPVTSATPGCRKNAISLSSKALLKNSIHASVAFEAMQDRIKRRQGELRQWI